jgi:hypothetical protein
VLVLWKATRRAERIVANRDADSAEASTTNAE